MGNYYTKVEYYYHSPNSAKHNGIFTNHLANKNEFLYLKGSSYSESKNIEDNVFIDQSKFWQSQSIPNSNFTVTFLHSMVKLQSISLKSCEIVSCIDSFDVAASNNNESTEWDHICSIRQNDDAFFNKITNVECKADLFYTNYKLTHVRRPEDTNYNDHFTIHFLEFFGNVIDQTLPPESIQVSITKLHFLPLLCTLLMSK